MERRGRLFPRRNHGEPRARAQRPVRDEDRRARLARAARERADHPGLVLLDVERAQPRQARDVGWPRGAARRGRRGTERARNADVGHFDRTRGHGAPRREERQFRVRERHGRSRAESLAERPPGVRVEARRQVDGHGLATRSVVHRGDHVAPARHGWGDRGPCRRAHRRRPRRPRAPRRRPCGSAPRGRTSPPTPANASSLARRVALEARGMRPPDEAHVRAAGRGAGHHVPVAAVVPRAAHESPRVGPRALPRRSRRTMASAAPRPAFSIERSARGTPSSRGRRTRASGPARAPASRRAPLEDDDGRRDARIMRIVTCHLSAPAFCTAAMALPDSSRRGRPVLGAAHLDLVPAHAGRAVERLRERLLDGEPPGERRRQSRGRPGLRARGRCRCARRTGPRDARERAASARWSRRRSRCRRSSGASRPSARVPHPPPLLVGEGRGWGPRPGSVLVAVVLVALAELVVFR